MSLQDDPFRQSLTKMPDWNSNRSFQYPVIQVIGRGSFSTVYLGVRRIDGTQVAIKQIPKQNNVKEIVVAEAEAQSNLKHRCLISLFDRIETDSFYYLIFEYFKGKDLLLYLEERNFEPLQEDQAQKIMMQLVDCILYFHHEHYVHRDIKLENILMDDFLNVKLVDFGFSTKVSFVKPKLDRFLGSQDYAAPEILKHIPYDGFKADVWSLGTILYALLVGELPFVRFERIQALSQDLPHPCLRFPAHISLEARGLISKMLEEKPTKRISMYLVSRHPWISPTFTSG